MADDKNAVPDKERADLDEKDEKDGKQPNFLARLTATHKLLLGAGVMMIIFLVIIVIMVMMFLKSFSEEQASALQTVSNKIAENELIVDKESTAQKSKAATPKVNLDAMFVKIEPPFVVNFDDTRGARFLQVTIEIMVRGEQNFKIIEKLLPIIKNELIKLLSSQSYDELKSSKGKEVLRTRALKTVQDAMEAEVGMPVAEHVLFTSFVMQ